MNNYQVDDEVEVSLGNNSQLYIITDISDNEVYMTPEDNPGDISLITHTSRGWLVNGAEEIKYQITFGIGEANEDSVINYCTNLLLYNVDDDNLI